MQTLQEALSVWGGQRCEGGSKHKSQQQLQVQQAGDVATGFARMTAEAWEDGLPSILCLLPKNR